MAHFSISKLPKNYAIKLGLSTWEKWENDRYDMSTGIGSPRYWSRQSSTGQYIENGSVVVDMVLPQRTALQRSTIISHVFLFRNWMRGKKVPKSVCRWAEVKRKILRWWEACLRRRGGYPAWRYSRLKACMPFQTPFQLQPHLHETRFFMKKNVYVYTCFRGTPGRPRSWQIIFE